ncbi:MAG: hypothetical protein Q9186_002047 [Xanthomendoza sp. 1 TL-2023]
MAHKRNKHTLRIKALRIELPPPFNEGRDVDPDLGIVVRVDDRGIVAGLRELSGLIILRKIREAIHEAHWWFLDGECMGWVIAARQLPDGDVEVFADNLEHRNTLKTHSAWETVFLERLTQETYTYGVSVVGLKVDQLQGLNGEDAQGPLIQQLFEWNVSRIAPLKHPKSILVVEIRPTNRGNPICIVTLTLPEIANGLIKNGIRWNSTWYPCNKYIREWSLFQCSDCFLFGHTSIICTQGVRCVKCAHTHPESRRKFCDWKCVNCGGPHRSTAPSCPQRENEARSLRELKERPGSAGRFWPSHGRKKLETETNSAATSSRKGAQDLRNQQDEDTVNQDLGVQPIAQENARTPHNIESSADREPAVGCTDIGVVVSMHELLATAASHQQGDSLPQDSPDSTAVAQRSQDEQGATERYTPSRAGPPVLPPLIRRFQHRAAH